MNILRLVVDSTVGIVLSLGLIGCSQSLGQFTVASSNNVRNLNYSVENKTKASAKGEACARNILWFIPLNQQDDLLQRAMDNAISNGQQKGVDGDMLVNVRITYDTTGLIIYNDICYTVRGDLVKIDK
jgi:hypothetical protein